MFHFITYSNFRFYANIVRPQQSDAPAQAAGGLNTNEVVPNVAIPTQAAPAPSTQSPNLVQNIQNALSNIFPRPTQAAPNDAAQQIPSQTGTRGDQVAQGAAAQPVPTTSAPNIIANIANNVQNAINQITSIFPRPTATPAPGLAAAAIAPAAVNPGPNIVKGTRGDGEEVVEVVQNIEVVNDKVDLAKKDQ